jgi:cytoskeletal protein CcmA (bactofilin family)
MKWPFAARPVVPVTPPPAEVANTIGAKTFVKGDLRGDGFRIEGTVDGLVDSSGPIFIGESGIVNGCIRATDLVILGRVEGDIEASGHLEVGPHGRVIGDIAVESFHMHKGGIFRGVSRMADEVQREPARQLASVAPPPRHSRPPVATSSHRELATGALVSQERLLAGVRDEEAADSESSPDLRRANGG